MKYFRICLFFLFVFCLAAPVKADEREDRQNNIISQYFSKNHVIELKTPAKENDPYLIIRLKNGKRLAKPHWINCSEYIYDFWPFEKGGQLIIEKLCDDMQEQYEIINLSDGASHTFSGQVVFSPEHNRVAAIDYGHYDAHQINIRIWDGNNPNWEMVFLHNQIEAYNEAGLANINEISDIKWHNNDTLKISGSFCKIEYEKNEDEFVSFKCRDTPKKAEVKILPDPLLHQWHIEKTN